MLTTGMKRGLASAAILALALVAYLVWGQSGLLIALLVGASLELWF